jgi:hypothetical protein
VFYTPSRRARQGHAEYEDLVVDVKTSVEGDAEGYSLGTEEVVVRLRKKLSINTIYLEIGERRKNEPR